MSTAAPLADDTPRGGVMLLTVKQGNFVKIGKL